MAQMIDRGKELIRINPQDRRRIEHSKDGGRSWHPYGGLIGEYGEFLELTDNGKEILAQTTEGLCYSKDEGEHWYLRRREKISSSSSRNASSSSSGGASSGSGGSGSGIGLGGGCCGLVVFLIIFIVYAAISGDLPEIAAGVFQLVKNLLASAVEAVKDALPSPSAGE